MPTVKKDHIGLVYGRWTVLSEAGEDRTGNRKVHTSCSCGRKKSVYLSHLVNGTSTSCGCFIKEKHTKHGQSSTKEYAAWWHMLSRCYKSTSERNRTYREKGITVCDRWNPDKGGSFENFLEDVGKCPHKEYSLDRINTDDNYTPENCRWTDNYQQAFNKGTYKNNTSGHKGVNWSKQKNKWLVFLWFDGIKYYGGEFCEIEDAILRRKELEKEIKLLKQ